MERRFGDGLLRDDGDDSTNPSSDASSPRTWTRIIGSIRTRTRLGTRPCQLAGLVVAILTLAGLVGFHSLATSHHPRSMRVAFLGNSITFVNDLPRFMEALSQQRIQQNSCLHGSLNLASILTKGNGMYNKWQTSSAVLVSSAASVRHTDGTDDDTASAITYDFGACTFPQLLLGTDEALTESNANGYYIDDGMNPCFQDQNYWLYLTQNESPVLWDYVVMNDQTVQPAIPRRRKRSLRALQRVYVGLINQTTTVPVFLSTYGYDKSLYEDEDEDKAEDEADDDDNQANNGNNANTNADVYESLGDIAEFTSRVWYGYQQYTAQLGSYLPSHQQPILVPSALAFLTVWEDNYEAWLQLFYDDGFHPSPHGTYLLGCCLYASLQGRMPPSSRRRFHGPTMSTAALFDRARRLHMESMGDDRPFPTEAEAAYLASVAERVVLGGHVPASLLSYETIEQMEADEAASNR